MILTHVGLTFIKGLLQLCFLPPPSLPFVLFLLSFYFFIRALFSILIAFIFACFWRKKKIALIQPTASNKHSPFEYRDTILANQLIFFCHVGSSYHAAYLFLGFVLEWSLLDLKKKNASDLGIDQAFKIVIFHVSYEKKNISAVHLTFCININREPKNPKRKSLPLRGWYHLKTKLLSTGNFWIQLILILTFIFFYILLSSNCHIVFIFVYLSVVTIHSQLK